jgi:hypothetical protein
MECRGEKLGTASSSSFQMGALILRWDLDGDLARRSSAEFAALATASTTFRNTAPPARSIALLRQNPAQGEAFDEKDGPKAYSKNFAKVKAPEGDLYQSDTALCHAGHSDRFTDS